MSRYVVGSAVLGAIVASAGASALIELGALCSSIDATPHYDEVGTNGVTKYLADTIVQSGVYYEIFCRFCVVELTRVYASI